MPPLLDELKPGASMFRETSWNTGLLDMRRPCLGLNVPPVFRETDADLSVRAWWPVDPELLPFNAASALLSACVKWVSCSMRKKFSSKLLI